MDPLDQQFLDDADEGLRRLHSYRDFDPLVAERIFSADFCRHCDAASGEPCAPRCPGKTEANS